MDQIWPQARRRVKKDGGSNEWRSEWVVAEALALAARPLTVRSGKPANETDPDTRKVVVRQIGVGVDAIVWAGVDITPAYETWPLEYLTEVHAEREDGGIGRLVAETSFAENFDDLWEDAEEDEDEGEEEGGDGTPVGEFEFASRVEPSDIQALPQYQAVWQYVEWWFRSPYETRIQFKYVNPQNENTYSLTGDALDAALLISAGNRTFPRYYLVVRNKTKGTENKPLPSGLGLLTTGLPSEYPAIQIPQGTRWFKSGDDISGPDDEWTRVETYENVTFRMENFS